MKPRERKFFASSKDLKKMRAHLKFHLDKWDRHAQYILAGLGSREKRDRHGTLMDFHRNIIQNLRALLTQHTGIPE